MSKFIEVKNDGKLGGAFNTFCKCISLENQCNRILNDEKCYVGSFADCWVTPQLLSDKETMFLITDTIHKISLQTYMSNENMYVISYNEGYLIFKASSETNLILKLKFVQEQIYSAFGKEFLENENHHPTDEDLNRVKEARTNEI